MVNVERNQSTVIVILIEKEQNFIIKTNLPKKEYGIDLYYLPKDYNSVALQKCL